MTTLYIANNVQNPIQLVTVITVKKIVLLKYYIILEKSIYFKVKE